MRLTLMLVALVLPDLVGCTNESGDPPQGYRCPVVELPAPVAGPAEPEAAAPPTRREQALAFVKLGFGDALAGGFGSLNFRTEALSTDVAEDAVMLVAEYNAFVGMKVAGALEQLRGDIMYYEFGRESSPVLYVHLPYWTSQQERSCPQNHCREGAWGDGQDARKLEPAEHAALVKRVRAAFQAAQADAIDPVMGDAHVLRVWWD